MYSTTFLKDFVIEYNSFQNSGVIVRNRTFQLKIKFIVCDSPERSFVIVFSDSNAKDRKNSSFRTFDYPAHHKGVSILTYFEPPIDMVNCFLLDPMHLLHLAVIKRTLELLLQCDLIHMVRISRVHKKRIGASQ